MANWMAVCSFSALTTALVFLAALLVARASHFSPWPYLQVYPPVNESDARTPLYFALMLSFGGDYTSIGALPGVQIALDYINSQPDILPGYSLHYTLTDSQVRGVHAFACAVFYYIHLIDFTTLNSGLGHRSVC